MEIGTTNGQQATDNDVTNGQQLSETLYIRNLEERIKLEMLKRILEHLFGKYGKILHVYARKTLRMRGQAFVVFEDGRCAAQALQDLQGFPLYGKPMLIQFSNSKSDIVVQRDEGELVLQENKKKRHAERERMRQQGELRPMPQRSGHRKATNKKVNAGEKPMPHVVDDLLPPNKLLLLQNLPAEANAEVLTQIFGTYQGFTEVRMVPGRRGIAFVEFENENDAAIARDSTTGMLLGETSIKVSFARKAS
ncbi:U1 snRNP-associated protein Usp102 [Schizosaccharomyces japonicus yFS275]|uniref:U1 snRNP-associated protein Usp102 n=1 Tax=Schizosaccharomyces japonicus (strain yFS275 / FY16936) TaxID=402676 RepID=B6K835_SCHJY|nr:U1 snRNP-associated protein Usp102 [Schizosaccharomyces japonicus yFS275]EEB09689.1 U1 snRNP-associated protein Usp102 [Schizosaccharomyces japonicus yFS275]